MQNKQFLTVDLAQTLVGKTIRCSYRDFNRGDHKFVIVAVNEQKKGPSTHRLNTVMYSVLDYDNKGNSIFGELRGETEEIIYERQGIFCQGSGGERLIVEKVL